MRRRKANGTTDDDHGRGGGRDARDLADIGVRVRNEERDPDGAAGATLGRRVLVPLARFMAVLDNEPPAPETSQADDDDAA